MERLQGPAPGGAFCMSATARPLSRRAGPRYTVSMTLCRCLSALALSLMLAITSQAMALARGHAAPVGQVVLCIAGGLATVMVDAQSNPTGPAHICPDAVQHLADGPGLAAPLAQPATRLAALEFAPARALPARHTPDRAFLARGPPAFA